jgi:UDP-galactopyranose mutase
VVSRDTAPFRDRPVRSAADAARAELGPRLYETFVAGYIRKQWDADPEQLAPEVFTSRFKIRYQKSSTYFPASSRQALPVTGYSGLCAALSEHERIDVELGVHASYRSLPRFGRLCLVTAPIAMFFDNRFGVLERRHISVDWGYRPAAEAPTAAVITYPEPAVGHYRTHVPAFLPWNDPVPANQVPTGTVLVGFEHSGTGEHTTSFVTRTAANAAVAERYRQVVRWLPGFIFGGRGTTFYDDMATTIATALRAADAAVSQLDAVRR